MLGRRLEWLVNDLLPKNLSEQLMYLLFFIFFLFSCSFFLSKVSVMTLAKPILLSAVALLCQFTI